MNIDLSEKHAVVCGASQGIGRACAEEFATLGARVTLIARSEAKLSEVCAGLDRSAGQEHRFVVADFDDSGALREAAEQIATAGTVHILVNNSGGPPAGPIFTADPQAFASALTRHVIANQILVQAFVPGMKEVEYGRILQIISTSVREPIPNLGVSNTTRGAVASWAKTLAKELGPFGITVNNLLPGFTDTARLDSLLSGRADREGKDKETLVRELADSIPARRFARPQELAFAAAFLASPSAAYINGVSLPVDGGRLNSI